MEEESHFSLYVMQRGWTNVLVCENYRETDFSFLEKDISRELYKHGRRSLQREVGRFWSLFRGCETAYPLFLFHSSSCLLFSNHTSFFQFPKEAASPPTPSTCETETCSFLGLSLNCTSSCRSLLTSLSKEGDYSNYTTRPCVFPL